MGLKTLVRLVAEYAVKRLSKFEIYDRMAVQRDFRSSRAASFSRAYSPKRFQEAITRLLPSKIGDQQRLVDQR